MMEAIYKKFAVEHGLKLGAPTSFSLIRYQKEIERLEQWCDTHLNTMFQLMTHEKAKVTQKFFEEVASQVRRSFDSANRDAESWLKAIMAPMETQVREHQIQLKRRLESIKRIHQATEEDVVAALVIFTLPGLVDADTLTDVMIIVMASATARTAVNFFLINFSLSILYYRKFVKSC